MKMRYKHLCPTLKAFSAAGSAIAIPCGMWMCPNCSKFNARMWAWRVKLQLTEDERQAFFWTLTMRGGYRHAGDAYAVIPRFWDSLRKYIQRELGGWTYCAFVEGQPKRGGMPHFHIISLAKSPYRLKDMAFDYGFGYQAKEIEIDGLHAASYVAKYASKGDKFIPRSFRRVRASQDWVKLPDRAARPALVPARGESLVSYFDRVAEQTSQSIDEVKDKWFSFDMRQIEY